MTNKFYVNKSGFLDNTIAVERIDTDHYICHLVGGATCIAPWTDKEVENFRQIIEVESLEAALKYRRF